MIVLMAQLANRRRASRLLSMQPALTAEPDRAVAVPLRERFAALRSTHPLPPSTGALADKTFFDELCGEGW